MTFTETLARITWALLCEGSVSYRRLRREFDLDHAALEDVRHELVLVKRIAEDEDGEALRWAGSNGQPALSPRRLTSLVPAGSQTEAIGEAAAPIPAVASDAERRPLTVMFCDLADSTALSARVDPEDLQDMIRAYQERVTSIVRGYDGFVAKFMGDGILIYFGYPKALERNAERAIRSALAIVEAMRELNRALDHPQDIEIAVRIGIATGLVVVGAVVGEGLAQERTVVGEAPNVAARLQGVARRNGIVIGSLTREIAGDGFLYEDLGSHTFKGLTGRIQVWGVLAMKDDARGDLERTPSSRPRIDPVLVGRDEEAGLLRRAWQTTQHEGRGQVVTVTGEAGIGKSVLVEGLRSAVRGEGGPTAIFRCSPYHLDSALYPVIEHLTRIVAWQPEEAPESRLCKLERMLERFPQPLGETVPILAAMLSLPVPGARYPPSELAPHQQKQATLDMIVAMTMAAADQQPLLQVWDDLHWADPSTLELLGLLIEQAPTVPLLIVLTARPEFAPPWPNRSHVTPISLNRLERAHTAALIATIGGPKPMPADVVDHIVAKTDGVPLYVEELTKTILASGILRDVAGRLELTGPLESLSIPATLQESLMARLDSLPQVREIAQLCSVVGREFAYEMISGVSAAGDAALQEGLARLVEAELLYQRGRPPRARYIFKHALVQDAAYQSLMKRTRRRYHKQVAERLEACFPDVVKIQPELVARHYVEAGEPARALPFWKSAAERALNGSAIVEAVNHLEASLRVVEQLPASAGRDAQECEIQMLLGPARLAVHGYAYPALEESYRRALDLCTSLGRPLDRIRVMRALQLFHMMGGRLLQSRDLAERIGALVADLDRPAYRVAAAHVLGQTNFFLGDHENAKKQLRQGIASFDPNDPVIENWPGGASAEQCHLYAAFIDVIQGRTTQAHAHGATAMELARAKANKFNLATTLAFVALVHTLNRDQKEACRLADEGVALCAEQRNSFYLPFNVIIRAWSSFGTHDPCLKVDEIREALRAYNATGAVAFGPYFRVLLAEGLIETGEPREGLALIDEGMSLIEATGERCWLADLHRARGDLIVAGQGPADAAEASYVAAIRIARQQAAILWEQRAAIGLAKLWHQQHRAQEAQDLLAPLCHSVELGAPSHDLTIARSLLGAGASA